VRFVGGGKGFFALSLASSLKNGLDDFGGIVGSVFSAAAGAGATAAGTGAIAVGGVTACACCRLPWEADRNLEEGGEDEA